VYKKRKNIFFCMIFAATGAFSQEAGVKGSGNLFQDTTNKALHGLTGGNKTGRLLLEKQVIAPNFYVQQLGFFCKQEIKMDRITRVPLRFRLGSVDDCDRLEGKKDRKRPL
jgi:hypothetical protein